MISSLQTVAMVTRARRCSGNNFGRKMDLLFSVIVLKLVIVSGQYASSPCPGVFDYQNSGGQVFGVITLQPSGPVSSVILRANFTIAARLPSSYVGQVQPVDQERALQRYNQGAPLVYQVHFPVTSPLPRLYALVVNDQMICYGPMDVPGPNQYVSTISLQHMLFLRGGVNSVYPVNRPNRPTFVKPNNGFSPQGGDTQVFTFSDDGLGGGVKRFYWVSRPNLQTFVKPNIRFRPQGGGTQVITFSDDGLGAGFHSFVVDKNGDPNFNVYKTQRTTTPAFNPFTTQRPNFNQFTTQSPAFNQYPNQPSPDFNPYTTQRPPQPPPDYNPYTTQRPPQPPPDYNPYTTEKPRPPPRPSFPATPTRLPSGPDFNRVECGIVAGGNERQPLINRGLSYERGEWPWLVAIFTRKSGALTFSCGGTLISDRHIVTAAHCINVRGQITSTRDFVVKIGVHDLDDWSDEQSVTRALESAQIHDSFNSTVIANDIAVFVLDKAVTFTSTIRPACLWDGNSDQSRIVGASGVVVGWGFTENTVAGRGPPKLARMPIVSTSTCRASKPDFHMLTSDTTLCAGDRGGSGPCRGDSGGGLYILDGGRWRLRGVVSLALRPENGDDTCLVNQYIIFTDAAKFNPWIKNIVRSSQL